MANANTDLTEEDASDLQFPKENPKPSFYSYKNLVITETDTNCVNCTCDLVCPYIYCAECRVNLCTACFSNGVELLEHRNDHNYHIIRDDFSVFENTDWTAKEEITLLDSLLKYKNWGPVSKQLPNRSLGETKKHYDHFYLDRCGSKMLPTIPVNPSSFSSEEFVPFRFHSNDTDEPPRYTPNTAGYKSLAGYNPARSDFECEFDSNAEDLLSNLKPIDQDDEHFDMLTNLQCGIVRCYNRRLQERQRWKKIVRDHGLIVLRKINAWLHRYDLTITRPVYDKMICFMQFFTPLQFDLLMEGLHRCGELKVQILRLCEFRRKGIKSLAEARMYLRLNQIHEDCENDLKSFQSDPILNWKLNKQLVSDQMLSKKRPGFTPIEIVGMPGYEKLTSAERDLCSSVRLVPISYLELKEILVMENRRMGSVKLKTARKILKIDVNKTRRLYDFLVQEGFIKKSV